MLIYSSTKVKNECVILFLPGGSVRNRRSIPILRGASIVLLSVALVMVVIALIGYSRQRNNYPGGMKIAGVNVGGVDPQIASQRVLQVYSSPIEVQYGEASIHINPSVVGFELELDTMIAAADLERTGFVLGGIWNYLWNREPQAVEVPLSSTIEEERLTPIFKLIATRYDDPRRRLKPVPDNYKVSPGTQGRVLD